MTQTEHWEAASSDLNPDEIAALPTEPAQLLIALNESPDGDSAQELLGEIIYDGYAPTKVWAAANRGLRELQRRAS